MKNRTNSQKARLAVRAIGIPALSALLIFNTIISGDVSGASDLTLLKLQTAQAQLTPPEIPGRDYDPGGGWCQEQHTHDCQINGGFDHANNRTIWIDGEEGYCTEGNPCNCQGEYDCTDQCKNGMQCQ